MIIRLRIRAVLTQPCFASAAALMVKDLAKLVQSLLAYVFMVRLAQVPESLIDVPSLSGQQRPSPVVHAAIGVASRGGTEPLG